MLTRGVDTHLLFIFVSGNYYIISQSKVNVGCYVNVEFNRNVIPCHIEIQLEI